MAFTNKTALVSQGLSEALGFKAHNHELNSDMVAKQLEHLKEKAWRSPRGFRQQEKNEDSLADFVPDHTCPCDMVKRSCTKHHHLSCNLKLWQTLANPAKCTKTPAK